MRHETAELTDGDLLGLSVIGSRSLGGPARGCLRSAPCSLFVGAVGQRAVMIALPRPRPDPNFELGRAGAVRRRAGCRHAGYATCSSTGVSSSAGTSLTRDHTR